MLSSGVVRCLLLLAENKDRKARCWYGATHYIDLDCLRMHHHACKRDALVYILCCIISRTIED